MTTEIESIIGRLEKATGPDREIDGEIEAALGAPSFTRFDLAEGYHWEFEADGMAGEVSAFSVLGNKTSRRQKRFQAPVYTASVDAALTLLPEGFKWKLGYSRHVPCVAELVDYSDRAAGQFVGECDSNHAVALTLAALRARLSQKAE